MNDKLQNTNFSKENLDKVFEVNKSTKRHHRNSADNPS